MLLHEPRLVCKMKKTQIKIKNELVSFIKKNMCDMLSVMAMSVVDHC